MNYDMFVYVCTQKICQSISLACQVVKFQQQDKLIKTSTTFSVIKYLSGVLMDLQMVCFILLLLFNDIHIRLLAWTT